MEIAQLERRYSLWFFYFALGKISIKRLPRRKICLAHVKRSCVVIRLEESVILIDIPCKPFSLFSYGNDLRQGVTWMGSLCVENPTRLSGSFSSEESHLPLNRREEHRTRSQHFKKDAMWSLYKFHIVQWRILSLGCKSSCPYWKPL